MKAVYFLGNRQLEIREVPDPTPGVGEVVLEIKASGMCGSDLKYYRSAGGADAIGLGKRSAALVIGGHEPCGAVAEIGPGVVGALYRVGIRVMNHHYAGCGCCRHCRAGWTQMCDDGAITFGANGDGAHARYMKVPADSLIALPDELSFRAGAAISCGFGTAWGGLERLGLRGGETIAIFGQGPVGLSGTLLADAMGARVIAIDIDANRLERAAGFGAEVRIDAAREDVVAAIRELTNGRGVDCAMDCSGVESARIDAIRATGKWGRVVFIGEGGKFSIDVSTEMIRKQLTVMGSWTFSRNGQAECARFVTARQIDVDRLFTHSWTLEQAEEAYRLFDTQTTGKGVLLPG